MLFHITQKPRPGMTNEDQKKSLEMFSRWEAPAGFEVKMHVFAPDGTIYGLADAKTAEAVYDAMAPWAGVYLDLEVKPVIEVEAAIPLYEKAIAFREG
jgi:hypothetical protein